MKQLKLLLIMSALAGVATGVKANYVEFGPFLDTRYAANTYPALTAVIEDVDNDTVAVHLKIGAYVTNPDVTSNNNFPFSLPEATSPQIYRISRD